MTEIFNKSSQIVKRKILRRNIPDPENVLWQYLKNRKLNNLKFRRQFSIGRYVADFYCPALLLVIEIDGDYHTKKEIKKYDADRENFMSSLEINCLRFSNRDVEENIGSVINKISSFSLSLRRRGSRSDEG
ncbi:MAG: endonuclease domain-containing protein [bacterium]|nr:endonuclease domain-containing protein [bacterium]